MTTTLAHGGRVEIRGFGAFSVKDYKSYTGRNPKTGEEVQVSQETSCLENRYELRQRVDSVFQKQVKNHSYGKQGSELLFV